MEEVGIVAGVVVAFAVVVVGIGLVVAAAVAVVVSIVALAVLVWEQSVVAAHCSDRLSVIAAALTGSWRAPAERRSCCRPTVVSSCFVAGPVQHQNGIHFEGVALWILPRARTGRHHFDHWCPRQRSLESPRPPLRTQAQPPLHCLKPRLRAFLGICCSGKLAWTMAFGRSHVGFIYLLDILTDWLKREIDGFCWEVRVCVVLL